MCGWCVWCSFFLTLYLSRLYVCIMSELCSVLLVSFRLSLQATQIISHSTVVGVGSWYALVLSLFVSFLFPFLSLVPFILLLSVV